MVKNYAKTQEDEISFNLLYPLYQMLVTLLLILFSAVYLYISVETDLTVIAIIIVTTLLNANSSIISFLRLYEKTFVTVQELRIAVLCLKLFLMLVLPLDEISLISLLLIFLLADCITTTALLYFMHRIKGSFKYDYRLKDASYAALIWGSCNAMFRNMPRLMVFFIAERFYGPQSLIDLRIFLLARENLASMMSILNLVFYREIFHHNRFLIFSLMFLTGIVFQIGYVAVMNLAGLSMVITMEVILFYASVSSNYGMVQQHWGLIKDNREIVQFVVNAIAVVCMAIVAIVAISQDLSLNILTYLTVFYGMWFVLIGFSASTKNSASKIQDK